MRDLNKELFGSVAVEQTKPDDVTREVSLKDLAELSELTEEQAKIRLKVTRVASHLDALSDGLVRAEHHQEQLKETIASAASRIKRLTQADDLHTEQLGTLSDRLLAVESQLEAHTNALAFLRNSDGQQQQSLDRLKQSRITLTHILLFGILLCAGSAITLDVDKAFNFQKRLNQVEMRLYP